MRRGPTAVALRLIVTRPAAQAADAVRQLAKLGLRVAALPLIGIEPVPDPAALQAAWLALPRCKLVVFVSGNAVEHFFAAVSATDAVAGVGVRVVGPAWPVHVLAGSTGPGTSAALRVAGVPDAQIVEPAAGTAQFDSEALWAALQALDGGNEWTGQQVLVVRGEGGRDWLSDVLRQRGAQVDFLAAYRRIAPRLDAAGQALLDAAQADPAQHLWLFSSSEAVAWLRTLAPAADWSRGRALASHPRIVQAACELGFGRVHLSALTPQAVAQAVLPPTTGPAAQVPH